MQKIFNWILVYSDGRWLDIFRQSNYLMDDDRVSSNNQNAKKIREWTKKENTSMVLARDPPMIKLERWKGSLAQIRE